MPSAIGPIEAIMPPKATQNTMEMIVPKIPLTKKRSVRPNPTYTPKPAKRMATTMVYSINYHNFLLLKS